LIAIYLGYEIVIVVVVEYDEKLLLPLLMETKKLLMFEKVEMNFNLHSQVYSKGLFHTTKTTNTYRDIVSRVFVGC
jgi:hypothetical protein